MSLNDSSLKQPISGTTNQFVDQTGSSPKTASELYQRLGISNPFTDFNHESYPVELSGGRDHPIFEQLIRDVKPSLIIEVGTWKGKSAAHMAGLLREQKSDGVVICIDTWLGSLTHFLSVSAPEWRLDSYREHGYPTIYYQFLANIKHLGLQDWVVPLPNTSNIAAQCLTKWRTQAELIYIDGSHAEEDVYQDLNSYWGLLAPGGVMFGDDWQIFTGVNRAVQRFAAEQNLPFWTVDWNWAFQKPDSDTPTGQYPTPDWVKSTHWHEPQRQHLSAAQLKQQELEQTVNQLTAQLQATQHLAEVASREVENLHNSIFFKAANLYWHWRDYIKRLIDQK